MTPPSTARSTIGSAAASSSAHSRLSCSPKLIIPRHTRETRRPVSPRFTYSISSSSFPHTVGEPRELLVARDVDELEVRGGEPAGEERSPAPERHRRDADEDLVEEPMVGELPDEVAAADEPDVLVGGCSRHLLVRRYDVALDELDPRSGNRRERPVREDPARRISVVAAPLIGLLQQVVVLEDPLVRGRAHRRGPDLGEECAEGILALLLAVDLEEPVEGVVLVGDESVQGRCGVVLRLRHAATLPVPRRSG